MMAAIDSDAQNNGKRKVIEVIAASEKGPSDDRDLFETGAYI